MTQPLRVLIVEDSDLDCELVVRALRKAGYSPEWQRVETEEHYLQQLHSAPEIILSDYEMPQFSGPRALELLKSSGNEIPFIIISGTIGEDVAVDVMKSGASDYLIKDRLTRLGPAVSQALLQHRLQVEREQTRRELEHTHDQLQHLLEHSPAVIYSLTVEESGHVVANVVSENITRMLGCSVDEALSSGWWERRVHPQDLALGMATVAKTIELGFCTQEYRIQHNDGHYVWVEDNRRLVQDPGGQRLEIAGVWTDITARKQAEESLKQSEERFRQLAENIEEVFWITDPLKQEMLYISPAYEIIWGRSTESLHADPQQWVKSIHEDDRDRVLQAALKQAEGPYHEEYRVLRPDGSLRWIRDRAFPVRNAAGEIYRIVGVAEDITERKKLEQQFLRAQRMESIGTLAGGIAHDLNNMLTPIQMAVDLLKIREQDPKRLRLINTIETSARRGADMVSQVLSFARGVEGQRIQVQISHLLTELEKFISETLPKNIRIRSEVEPDLWSVQGDATQLHQVLLNLCVNARDAMPDGGELLLKAKNIDLTEAEAAAYIDAKAGPHVCVQIEDTGTGIPPEIIDRVFEPFFTTKDHGKGTGLGLSTTLGIVKSHGGSIRVHSAPGSGTRFSAYLPADQASIQALADPGSAEPVHGHGELLLIVDDEDLLRETTQATLESFGYRVLSAASGAEAMDIYRAHQHEIAAVLTDMMMPEMDGPTLIKHLISLNPRLRFIAASGVSFRSLDMEEHKEATCCQLPKPFTAKMLLKACREVLK